ncbi:hypothetical protein Patl1_31453 [Pistacia atlantica]|uniref:Uncharacterized protein n=1 Tax=Pistacia atlantica TaxID=434234 RepID=A0ACC1ANB5_9ROSI|nr:hypothetical protein Patl1_31453 [Pistacia atlantica]
MNSVRSYASVALLNGEIMSLVVGIDAHGTIQDEWTLCPSLKKAKSGLGGVTFDNKIYAIGVGNSVDCFLDVEMSDLKLERWISMLPLQQKVHFSPAFESV